MVDPNSNMYHRCVTSTGQPDFQAPNCEPLGGTGKGGWSAGGGSKPASCAPHPPPERKKSLNLKLDMLGGNVKSTSGPGNYNSGGQASHDSSYSGSCKQGSDRSWDGGKAESKCPYDCNKDKESKWEKCHDVNCPVSHHKVTKGGGGGCHDVNCPVRH